jgi:hypothetical protein
MIEPPFDRAGKEFNYFFDDISKDPKFGASPYNPNHIYKPLDWFGRNVISLTYAGVRTMFDPYPISGPVVQPENKQSPVMPNNNRQNTKKTAKKQTKKGGPPKKRGPPKKKTRRPRPVRERYGRRSGREVKMNTQRTGIESMPSTFGSIVNGSTYRFIKARNYNCMRMIVRFWLGELNVDTNGILSFLITSSTGLVDTGGQWYLNPANSYYMSGAPFYNLAGMFQTYYVLNARLLGFTKLSTSVGGTLSFGSSDDPSYFESSGTVTATTNPSKRLVTEMYSAQTVPAWQPSWAVNCRSNPDREYFVRGPDGSNAVYSYGDIISNQRQCYSHVVGFQYDGPLPAIGFNTRLCDIYVEMDIELCDFSSQFMVAPNLSFNRRFRQLEESVLKIETLEKKEAKSSSSKGTRLG